MRCRRPIGGSVRSYLSEVKGRGQERPARDRTSDILPPMTRPRAGPAVSALVLAVLLAAHPHATVIVGVQFRGRVVIAADSSTIDENGVLLDRNVCKLVAGEREIFETRGHDHQRILNAFHLAADAAHGARSVTDAHEQFVASVEPPLRALVHDDVQHPQPVWLTIASRCRDDRNMLCGNLLHYVIAGEQANRLRVSIFAVNFRSPESPTVTLDQIKLTVDLKDPIRSLALDAGSLSVPFALGTYNAITANLIPVLQLGSQPPRAALEQLVSKQLKATPTRTRGPIDVIQFTPGRPPEWLKRKPECEDPSGEVEVNGAELEARRTHETDRLRRIARRLSLALTMARAQGQVTPMPPGTNVIVSAACSNSAPKGPSGAPSSHSRANSTRRAGRCRRSQSGAGPRRPPRA